MISSSPDGTIVDVKVIPRGGRSAIAGTRDDAVLVRLNAAPTHTIATTRAAMRSRRVLIAVPAIWTMASWRWFDDEQALDVRGVPSPDSNALGA